LGGCHDWVACTTGWLARSSGTGSEGRFASINGSAEKTAGRVLVTANPLIIAFVVSTPNASCRDPDRASRFGRPSASSSYMEIWPGCAQTSILTVAFAHPLCRSTLHSGLVGELHTDTPACPRFVSAQVFFANWSQRTVSRPRLIKYGSLAHPPRARLRAPLRIASDARDRSRQTDSCRTGQKISPKRQAPRLRAYVSLDPQSGQNVSRENFWYDRSANSRSGSSKRIV
jgi:hypothetical protein